VRRTRQDWGEADILREETGKSTEGALRRRGPDTYTRTTEITSGWAIFQQGPAATCKDLPTRDNRRMQEDFGLAHEPIRAMREG